MTTDLSDVSGIGQDIDDDLVAAVREEVIAYGVRRATVTSVARRAGVSRVTVYRRGGDIKALIQEALFREFQAAANHSVTEVPEQLNARETLIARGFVVLGELAESPLVGALLQHDPEILLPYLVDHYGRGQRSLVLVIEAWVRAGIADGSIRSVDPVAASHLLLQAIGPFVFARAAIGSETDEAAVLDELVTMVRAYLTPEQVRS